MDEFCMWGSAFVPFYLLKDKPCFSVLELRLQHLMIIMFVFAGSSDTQGMGNSPVSQNSPVHGKV